MKTTPKKNECGDCTFCCTAPAIERNQLTRKEARLIDAPKAACVTCKHAKNGCAVYDKRPKLCREYACLYLLGHVDLRPDKAHVAWTPQPTDDGELLLMGHCDKDIDAVLAISQNLEVIDGALRGGTFRFVVLRNDTEAYCFMRDGTLRHAKIDQTDPVKMRILEHTERAATFNFETE